jgi:hypothetical protein
VTRSMIIAWLVFAPASLALAQESRGSCEYSSEKSAAQKLTFCTHVSSESSCMAEAARKTSPEWLKDHPPHFKPGGDCTDGGKAMKKSATKQGHKKDNKHAQPSTKGKKTEAAAADGGQ